VIIIALRVYKAFLHLETTLNEPVSISQHTKSLRTDLLIAADSLTSAMSSLVQQLNTGTKKSFDLIPRLVCSSGLSESTESLPMAVEPLRNGQADGNLKSIDESKTNGNEHQFP
jgi:hypothetical protein